MWERSSSCLCVFDVQLIIYRQFMYETLIVDLVLKVGIVLLDEMLP